MAKSRWAQADIERLLKEARSGPVLENLRRALAVQAEHPRQVPGIVFAQGPTGWRARIAGSGLEVFEVIEDYLDLGEDREALVALYDWLSPAQLDAAIAYYQAYPDEIEDRIALGEAFERAFDAMLR